MSCSGSMITPLQFGSNCYQWTFQIAPVSVPILRAVFLHHLLLDIAGECLLEPTDILLWGEYLPTASNTSDNTLQANRLSTIQVIKDILTKFSDKVFSSRFFTSEPKHELRHHIITNPGQPVFAKPQFFDPDKLASAVVEFSAMEKAGIIHCSNSLWSSPLYVIKKKDSGWRPCRDYHSLNTTTIPNPYPLPNNSDFTSRYSLNLILHKRYYQVSMSENSNYQTAWFVRISPPSLWLRNARNTFQGMMAQILGDLPFCFVFVDNILIYSPWSTYAKCLSCSASRVSPLASLSVYSPFPILNSWGTSSSALVVPI